MSTTVTLQSGVHGSTCGEVDIANIYLSAQQSGDILRRFFANDILV